MWLLPLQVRKAEVNFDKKEAYVTAEKKTLDTQAMIKALEKVGCKGSVKQRPSGDMR